MLRHYIKVALRLIRRSLLFSSINLMGFVLGLTAAFLIYLWVVDELTHDDCFRDGSLIYRVTELHREAGGEIKESPRLPRTLAMDFRQKFPQVEDATAIKYGDRHSYEAEDGKKMTVTEVYVDSTFFRFFTFPVVEGTLQRINDNPNNVVISSELARKFFGSGPAVGQKLTFSFGNSTNDVYTVVAVVDIPRKSHIRFEMAMSMDAYGRGGVSIDWDTFTESMHVYVKMKQGSTMHRSEAQAMSRLLADRGEKNIRLGFQPLHDIYLHTCFADPDVEKHGNLSTVYLFIVLAVLVIFMGAFNFTTLSTARASLRYKEVGGRKTGRKGGLIRGLVCVQFVIALVLMLLTGIVFKQLYYMQNKDMGLDKENIVCIYTSLWYNVGDFKQELLRNPDIKGVSMSSPIDYFGEGTNYKDGNKVEWTDVDGRTDSVRMVQLWADDDFVKTFGMQLVKGKLMDADFDNYWDHGTTKTAVINETAWRAMKVADPIGLEIRPEWGGPMRIVGVVKDFNFQSMREQIKPAYIWYNPEALSYLYIKIAPERRQQTLAFIKEKFEEFATRDNTFIKDFSYQFFSDKLNQNYVREQQQSRMLLFFTVLAILIAVMGVFGLVALSTEQRTKEIGIRKVNGAHSDRIVRMFCREYLVWVGIAFVVACPVGYWLMSSWLSEFAYQTPISWWLFLLAGLLTAAITLLTVVGQTWRKASQNPVESLRYE